MSTNDDDESQREQLREAADLAGISVGEIALPAEHDVLARRMRLHYLEWPHHAGARTVLFLHGGALTAHTWDLTCLALSDAYRCIALDQRGHGESEWSAAMDYSLGAHVDDIEHVVAALGLEDFILVGMSLGGTNSIEFAARHSDQLKGLVLVDVGPELRAAGTSRISQFVQGESEFSSIDAIIERALAFNPRRNPEVLRMSLRNNLRRLPDGKWTWKYDRRHFGRFDPGQGGEVRRRLAGRLPLITCPTLVVRGAESDVFLDEDAEKLTSALPDGRWVKVPGAGHSVQGDNPRQFVGELLTFFGAIEA